MRHDNAKSQSQPPQKSTRFCTGIENSQPRYHDLRSLCLANLAIKRIGSDQLLCQFTSIVESCGWNKKKQEPLTNSSSMGCVDGLNMVISVNYPLLYPICRERALSIFLTTNYYYVVISMKNEIINHKEDKFFFFWVLKLLYLNYKIIFILHMIFY